MFHRRHMLQRRAIMNCHTGQRKDALMPKCSRQQHNEQDLQEDQQTGIAVRAISNTDGASLAKLCLTEHHQSCSREVQALDMSFSSDTVSTVDSDESTLLVISKTVSIGNGEAKALITTSEEPSTDIDRSSLSPRLPHVPIPTEAPTHAPHAYQRALRNRQHLKDTFRWDDHHFDLDTNTPTFLHDVLMLPGSLHNVLRHEEDPTSTSLSRRPKPVNNTENLIDLMTPALLPGYKAHSHPSSLQPALLASQSSHVHGMLVFNLTKADRRNIHSHYRSHAKRRKVQVEIDLEVFDGTSKRIERRAMIAYAYLWSSTRGGEIDEDGEEWTLEGALSGNLGPKQTVLRVEADGKGDEDEDGWIGRDVEVAEVEEYEEEREVVYGGSGTLDYERDTSVAFTGW